MQIRPFVALVLIPFLVRPQEAVAEIMASTAYVLDLRKPAEAAKKASWSAPDKIQATGEGLGWGARDDKGSRDVWIQTEAIGLGLSWRPTAIASIQATVEGDGADGLLYARYSVDGRHWTAWQYLKAAEKKPGVFQGTLRVPYRESARYHELRMEYARRDDVPWGSDEEALCREILRGEPKFFEKTMPFIGYVQLLYETQLRGGERLKGVRMEASWFLSGIHQPAKDPATQKDREGPWRFKAP